MPIISGGSSGAGGNPPGFSFGYDEITVGVNVTGLTAGTATTIITCAAHTFDGGAVWASFFASLDLGSGAGLSMHVGLFEGGTLLDVFHLAQNPTAGARVIYSAVGAFRFTPTSAAHSYVVGAWVNATTGTPNVVAGAHGAGGTPPAWVSFTKA